MHLYVAQMVVRLFLLETGFLSVEAEDAAAARDNLRAMLARLRQMGLFSDASDDFTVQRIHPPYAQAAADREE